jgi:hypothetical protein
MKSERNETMTTIVIHPATKIYIDYDTELEREHGFILETNGCLQRFDGSRSAKEELARWTDAPASIKVSMGEKIVRSVNLNPHGLV